MQDQENQVVRTGEWMLTMLVAAIPLINIIMFFVWAFGDNTKPSKSNWAKATLLWLLIGIVVYVLLAVVIGTTIFNGISSMGY